MKSNRIIHIVVCCLLAVFCSSLAQAKVEAQVDRTRLAIDETLTLTVSQDEMSIFSEPDFSVLAKDFTLLGQSKSSNTQIINGSRTSISKWIVGLAPKAAGQVVIPPLSVGKEKSEPINIQIDPAAPPKTKADGAGLFLETEIDRDSVFVQSQAIFTLRIYWAVEAQVNDPGDLVLEDAVVESLGDATYQKNVNGRMYKVFERRYAIFPQKSGVLEIPSILVAAVVPLPMGHNNYSMYMGRQGKRVSLRSESSRVTVLEKPPGYPVNAAWLPAENLVVREQLSQDSQDLKVGESITITITTTAKGLMGAQLPPISIADADKIKLYQNKAEETDSKDSGGITGVRTETIALIPTSPGEIELPEIRIPWWDKQQEKVRYAIAPATRLLIHGTAPTSQAPAPPVLPQPKPPMKAAANETKIPILLGSVPLFWVILCGGLGVAWLVTTLLFLRTRRRLGGQNVPKESGKALDALRDLGEDGSFKQLCRACRKNNLGEARSTLMVWAREFWPQENIRSGADLERVVNDPELISLVGEMDRLLYGHQDQVGHWDGAPLRNRVKDIRAKVQRAGKKKKKGVLPQLYKGQR